ncbi:MAG: hypothetical protein OQK51_20100 [Kangiellaceae bacterium]|nr:hypothetical protein [Kangiellaceae bacterium]
MQSIKSSKESHDSILKVLNGFFGVFDNRAEREPNWELLRKLCTSGVRIVKCESEHEQVDDLDGFIRPRIEVLSSGELTDFYETMVDAKIHSFGRIAHAFITYKKQGIYQGKPLLGYGKKSIQLLNMAGSWKIHSITWFDETDSCLIDDELKS